MGSIHHKESGDISSPMIGDESIINIPIMGKITMNFFIMSKKLDFIIIQDVLTCILCS